MSCRELRMSFVKDTGHYEFVKTVGEDAWVDNGGNRWLNEGIRWLSMRCTPPLDETRFKVPVRAGDYGFDVPNCRSIKRLWRNDPVTGGTVEVDKSTWEVLRNYFGEVPGAVDPAAPAWWCRNPRLGVAPTETNPADMLGSFYGVFNIHSEEEIIFKPLTAAGVEVFWAADGTALTWTPTADYDDNTAFWSSHTALLYIYTQTEGQPSVLNLSMTASDGITGIGLFRCPATIAADGSFTMTGGATRLTDKYGVEVPSLVPVAGAVSISIDMPEAAGTYAIVFSPDDPALWPNDGTMSITYCEVTDNEPVLADNFLLLPPADRDYTLEGIGSQYADALVNDDDVTWWTANHPSLVLRAAQMVFERMALRNESGARQFEPSLISDLLSIRYALAEEEMSGPAGNWIVGYER